MTDTAPGTDVEREIRALVAEATRLDPDYLAALPADTELFGPQIALTSLAGVALLAAVKKRYGVDVADLDIGLDSLESIGTLAQFVTRVIHPDAP
ncbi:acyl carrier protein [Streptomyces acidiscabies]|uniref:acyl carrier protein n=1 Tax=Streptomyces acidiscabies TaxID=42234 RepID=UPI000952B79C|nr:phosphopantetheine-binding protein [Streptomyces acidiscabies]